MVQSLLDRLNGIPDQLMLEQYSKVYWSNVEERLRREGQDRYVEMCHSRADGVLVSVGGLCGRLERLNGYQTQVATRLGQHTRRHGSVFETEQYEQASRDGPLLL